VTRKTPHPHAPSPKREGGKSKISLKLQTTDNELINNFYKKVINNSLKNIVGTGGDLWGMFYIYTFKFLLSYDQPAR
jgi:hypothetical protein